MSVMFDGLLLLGLIGGVDPAARAELPIQMAQANPPLTWNGLGLGIKRFYQTYHGLNWPTRGGEQNPFNWKWIAARFDTDGNGTITVKELGAPPEWFERLDRTRDGRLTEEDFDWTTNSTIERQTRTGRTTFRAMDADGNGKLTPEEWQAAFSLASKERGFLTDEELTRLLYSTAGRPGGAAAGTRNPAGSGTRASSGVGGGTGGGGSNSLNPFQRVWRFMEQGMPFCTEGPNVGDVAPDFILSTADKSKTIRLSELRHKKPVVISLGSFTCPPFRAMSGSLQDVHKRLGKDAEFIGVYIHEAHATDGTWGFEANTKIGIVVPEPRTMKEREDVSVRFCAKLQPKYPILVDEIDDRVGRAYCAMPIRLYIVDTSGRIVYKAGVGPFGYNPNELEQALILHLLDGKRLASGQQTAAKP